MQILLICRRILALNTRLDAEHEVDSTPTKDEESAVLPISAKNEE